MRFAAESWSALSFRESSVRLIYQPLGPTADGTGEEIVNGKLGMQIDMTVALLVFKYLI